jgi:hypothetical protein
VTLDDIEARCEHEGDCWIWMQGLNSYGYPQARIDGKGGQMVRRHAYVMSNRWLKGGMKVMASCDNKLCVNPAHLLAVTQSRIIKESYRRGVRSTAGEYFACLANAKAAGFVRLDFARARVLRERMLAGERVADISRETGFAQSHLRDIKNGRAWRESANGSSVFTWRPREAA